MARPTKLTPELQAALCSAVAAGMSLEGAAKYAGIADRTLSRWLARGDEEEEGMYVDFRRTIKSAEGLVEHDLVSAVMKAAKGGNWQAAMTMLERKWPERWAKREVLVQEQKTTSDVVDPKAAAAKYRALADALDSAEEEAA